MPYKQYIIEETSPETTRYRPTQSSARSQEGDNDYPQYDLNDIELPAFCRDHPDSKLLYLTQTQEDEILCCVYCALEQKQRDPNCNVIEIKDYLNDLIQQTKNIASQGRVQERKRDTNSICSQIISENDKEISRIKEYYNHVIEALTQERDVKIQELGQLTSKNIAIFNNIDDQSDAEKILNFESELRKVISGVKETGIHIKELQKIKYDFDEVVLSFNEEQQNSPSQEYLERYEFIMLGSDSLKELATKLGKFKVKEIPIKYYEKDFESSSRDPKKTRNQDTLRNENNPAFRRSHDERVAHKEKKRASSINQFKKNYKNTNKDSRRNKLVMKDKFSSDRENVPLESIPVSCMNYIKNSSSRSNHYSSIDKDDIKRSKSIENNAFRDIGNAKIYSNHQEFYQEIPEVATRNPSSKYMDFYDHKANSPLNILYESNGFKDTKTAPIRQYIPMPQSRGTKENNQPVRAKHDQGKPKEKLNKVQRF